MFKILRLIILGTALNLSVTSLAQAGSATETFDSYIAGGDQQDLDRIDGTLHREFESTFVFKGDDQVKTISRDALMDGFRSKKFGGNVREVNILSNTASENLHIINATLTGPDLTFKGVFVMQRIDSEWKLAKEFLIVEPRT